MHAAQHRNRPTIVDRLDDPRRKFQREIRLPLSDLSRVFGGRRPIDIADIGESLCAQQILREGFRGNADSPADPYNAHSGCFEGPVCGRYLRDVREAGRPRQCNAADEPAPGLSDRHWNPPLFSGAHPFSSRPRCPCYIVHWKREIVITNLATGRRVRPSDRQRRLANQHLWPSDYASWMWPCAEETEISLETTL